ncbi:MAG TPA: hypothetical protein VK961_20900 [Chthoniobacter sp.]|nr:hypothetical protein [Chthoniobacter sp.]
MRIVAAIILLFVACACSTPQTARNDSYTKTQQEAARVIATDGIDRNEAQVLATAYFHRFISGCGYVGTPERHGSYWVAQVFFGFAGTPHGYIRVDARTGAISRQDSPTAFPKDFSS